MERLRRRIARIREYHALVRGLQDDCLERFTVDPVYRGALLYYLYLMADSCIALAELVIRHRGLRAPQSYHEAFDVLGDANILDPGFAYEFAKIAGFRNLLAHDYERLDPRVICGRILPKLEDVGIYLQQIEAAIKQGAAHPGQ